MEAKVPVGTFAACRNASIRSGAAQHRIGRGRGLQGWMGKAIHERLQSKAGSTRGEELATLQNI